MKPGKEKSDSARYNVADVVIDYQSSSFDSYLTSIIHAWLKTLTSLAFTLIPLFSILDVFLRPEFFLRFLVYRGLATAFVVGQFVTIILTKPGRWSFVHGYLFSFVVSLSISQMTVDLGGFDSTYYAGINLVIIAVNLLLPWSPIHSSLTSALIIAVYLGLNFLTPHAYEMVNLINNLFFLLGTAVIAISINYVKYLLIHREYDLRNQILEYNLKLEKSERELKTTRDALWSEIELAKGIQTALLPQNYENDKYQIAATMLPASEVGGDYFDVKEGGGGNIWFNIGDVSGHGVTSGLIMMMAQTSIASLIQSGEKVDPSSVIQHLNVVLSENIRRLKEFNYMTLTLLRADPEGKFTYSGKHQDILLYRKKNKKVEKIETFGTWIGVVAEMKDQQAVVEREFTMEHDDVLLLYTDGVTEAQNAEGEMFGLDRLRDVVECYGDLQAVEIKEKILKEVLAFSSQQDDDITLLVVKRK
jgi:serine phosphatase RsbU (regulator of sigma subunit)